MYRCMYHHIDVLYRCTCSLCTTRNIKPVTESTTQWHKMWRTQGQKSGRAHMVSSNFSPGYCVSMPGSRLGAHGKCHSPINFCLWFESPFYLLQNTCYYCPALRGKVQLTRTKLLGAEHSNPTRTQLSNFLTRKYHTSQGLHMAQALSTSYRNSSQVSLSNFYFSCFLGKMSFNRHHIRPQEDWKLWAFGHCLAYAMQTSV